MARESTKEIQEKIVASMERWQKIEDASVASTGQVIAETENPIVRIVMEIIQRDSQMHHRVQGMIADSLTTKTVTLTPDEVSKVWKLIEKHIAIERQTIDLATQALEAMKGRKMLVQEYLIDYLLRDEEKHTAILENLEQVKAGMYPYG
jgi:hypothetical protein